MRDRIIDAAEQLLVEQGARAATTRALARAVGCAEGTLYVHFPDRLTIFSAVFEKRWPIVTDAIARLHGQVGHGSVVDNLTSLLMAIRTFMVSMEPLVAAIKSDPAVAAAMHKRWAEAGDGPHRMVEAIATYVEAEQAQGRASLSIEACMAGEALVGFIFYVTAGARFAPAGRSEITQERVRRLIAINVQPVAA